MKLITDGNDNYSYILESGEVLATTMYSLTAVYFLDLEQIKTLLPIKEDDEFEPVSIGMKEPGKMYLNLKRSLKTIRNNKIEEILKEDEFCHYSGLPSPSAYMVNEIDLEKIKKKIKKIRYIRKLLLLLYYKNNKKTKRERNLLIYKK
jgi:hypothetical protein